MKEVIITHLLIVTTNILTQQNLINTHVPYLIVVSI